MLASLIGPCGERLDVFDTTERASRGGGICGGELRSLLRWTLGDSDNQRILRRLLTTACIRTAGGDTLEALVTAAERGELHFELRTRPASVQVGRGSPTDLDDAEAEPLLSLARSWVGIELLDEDDQPVVGVRYEVRLPDGRIVCGRTDAKGQGTVEDTPLGMCTLTFPELDEEICVPA